jgi:hypothetical protein
LKIDCQDIRGREYNAPSFQSRKSRFPRSDQEIADRKKLGHILSVNVRGDGPRKTRAFVRNNDRSFRNNGACIIGDRTVYGAAGGLSEQSAGKCERQENYSAWNILHIFRSASYA